MAKNLWKGGRTVRGETRPAEGQAFAPADHDAEIESVGKILRKTREERGEDLRYVAQILRIRYPYLKAIEDGHPDELPGPTYAVGFVRTYADHLGLDNEKLVQQFKEEAADLQSRADLHFPAPLPEGKIPSGVVLVSAVVLAAVVYGGWIYLSSREQQVAENVPQLPSRISEIVTGKSDAPAKESTEGSMTANAPASASPTLAPSADEPPATARTENSAATTTGDTAPAGAMTSEAPQSQPDPAMGSNPAAAEQDRADAGGSDTSATAAPTSTAGAGSTDTIPAPPGDTDSSDSDVTPAPSIVASAPESSGGDGIEASEGAVLEEAQRAPPKIYGEGNSDARIVIHAAADSWVEVRDSATDELLLTRVLFKGDSYKVPDRGGLTLLTGNAGGLRIVVDGSDVPAIGPLGAVRRNVLLEPTALLAGNAARPGAGGGGPADSQTSDSGVQVQ